MQRVIEDLQQNVARNVEVALVHTQAARLDFYAHLPAEALRSSIQRIIHGVLADLAAGTSSVFPGGLATLGAQRIHHSSAQADMLAGVRIGFDAVGARVHEKFQDDYEARLWWETRYRELFGAGAIALSTALLQGRERLLDERTELLRRAQVPIVPLSDGILLVPLVGALDTDRGSDLKGRVLLAVSAHHARALLVDVTAVPTIDHAASKQLLEMARAVALLGSFAAFVGIGPLLARQIVEAGLDLGTTPTFSTLEDGLEHALRRLGKRIVTVRS